MATVSLRVDDDTKRRMDRLNINWSEVLRQRIHEVLEDQQDRDLATAVLLTEQVRRSSEDWDSTAEIRRWRESRGRR